MTVRVLLFGRAADQAGARDLALDVPEGATLRDVALRLAEQYPALHWLPTATRPARNLEYVSWTDEVRDGDEVSFIQAVSGG